LPTLTTPLRPVLTEPGHRYAVAAIVVQDSTDGGDTAELAALAAQLADDARRLLEGGAAGEVTTAVAISAPEPEAQPAVIEVDRSTRRALVGGRPVELSYREFELLAFLAEHPGRVFDRRHLLSSVWCGAEVGSRTIDVHVRRLRVKLGPEASRLSTIRNVGYRLDTGASPTLSVA
jgi:DNA-binding response OmpR family regulator